MKYFFTRKKIIHELAAAIAELQQSADKEYYKDNPPKVSNNDHAAWLLDQTLPLRDLSKKLNIGKEVYEEAYKIYDFHNSGKKGYTLQDGKIVKMEEIK